MRERLAQTGEFIASLASDDGYLPWFRGGQWDAWNHTEALMGLTVAGVASGRDDLLTIARRSLDYLASYQRPDGTWPMLVREADDVRHVEHDEADTNQCAYPVVGVWHYALATGGSTSAAAVYSEFWPMIERSVEYLLGVQSPDGTFPWATNSAGGVGDHALITGCSSILQSLWAAREIARALAAGEAGQTSGEHESASASGTLQEPGRLRDLVTRIDAAALRCVDAVANRPHLFARHDRHSMDWFYPVLGGAIPPERADAHLDARADEFLWPEWGVRCVNDHPWVTGGESAEYAMALARRGRFDEARQVLQDIAHLRDEDGGYWTGYVVDDSAVWPVEKTGWTAGSMLLAFDAVENLTGAANIFGRIGWHPGQERQPVSPNPTSAKEKS